MNTDQLLAELGEKLLSGEITPEEHVEEYNRLITAEANSFLDAGWHPHENI